MGRTTVRRPLQTVIVAVMAHVEHARPSSVTSTALTTTHGSQASKFHKKRHRSPVTPHIPNSGGNNHQTHLSHTAKYNSAKRSYISMKQANIGVLADYYNAGVYQSIIPVITGKPG
jgi:hypothetical protein